MTTNNTPERALRRLGLALLYLGKVKDLGDQKKLRFGINVVRHSINWLNDSVTEYAKLDPKDDPEFYQNALALRETAKAELDAARKVLFGRFKVITGGRNA